MLRDALQQHNLMKYNVSPVIFYPLIIPPDIAKRTHGEL